MERKRVIYFDMLRIVAIIGVIQIHITAEFWFTTDIHSFEWNVYNVYDSLARFAVPIFVMLSGAFMLDPNYPLSISKLYKKKILHLVTAFFFWSAIYSIYGYLRHQYNLKIALINLLKGPLHLWFLFMIVGLYLITPILREMIKNKFVTEYFLILSFIFTFFLQSLLTEDFVYIDELNAYINQLHFYFTLGYVPYFVAGYYLKNTEIDTKKEFIIYLLAGAALLSIIFLTRMLSFRTGTANERYYSYLSLNVFMVSIAVFVLFKNQISKIDFSEKTEKVTCALSQNSFGIYLVHYFISKRFSDIGFTSRSFNPIFSIPVKTITIFIISLIISMIIHRIPFLKKWVV